ncbi:type I-F CRISPR-associated protein Csy1 [Zestomonas carbonaria]|uniref:CRISPR-associated protein Csy1 n=1 Tax=Zestomonas carbonaria TaxID=2762745 RepID=A0A7U7EKK3_9GAMM|nr:type I-F CRISPR-associated protein Csy1 [Pseudomonas carbonaria]CAD5106712.1 CRISPR-associated protein Csy1 [Pseudomonas carbonaria]
MAIALSEDAASLRDLIHTFIHSRLQTKLDKLKPDEHDKRQQLIDDHRPHNWLADAARRVGQIQLATHTLKPIHPDARGSNLHAPPQPQELPGLVSSHCLGERWDDDVVGNAAALDVFKLLKLEHAGQTLLQRLLEHDPAALAALDDDTEVAAQWRAAFATITTSRGAPASHTLAKQVYFPLPDGGYHLLAPLFPTSLAHRVQARMRDDRYGELARIAREARRKGEPFSQGYCEYPNLAIQKFGGTKPQNISQLNSERYGENWLLAALPPQWQNLELRSPLRSDSVFDFLFRQNRDLRNRVAELKHFLVTTDHNNWAIRRKRARLLGDIADEFHQYAARLLDANRSRELAAGWSAHADCRLDDSERHWLDPLRTLHDDSFKSTHLWRDWPEQASRRFGNWLNRVLDHDKLRLSEVEADHWHGVLRDELKMFKEVLEDARA